MRLFGWLSYAFLFVVPALQASEPSPLYFGGSAHYFLPDTDRTDGKGADGQLFLGLQTPLLLGRGSLEFGAFSTSVGKDAPVPKYTVTGGEVLLRTLLGEQAGFSTYMLAGLGYGRNDEFEDDSGGFATGGVGLLVPVGNAGWYLRSDARMLASRTDAAEDLLFEYRFSLGLEYSIADANMPAPQPPPAEPVLAPAPTSISTAPLSVPVAVSVQDSDGDLVTDDQDQCPGTPTGTAVDAQGCPLPPGDADGDGILDDMDRCTDTPPGAAVDEIGCAVLMDADGDGIADPRDRCPGTPVGAVVDFEGCTIAQPDADKDGVPDTADKCPRTPAGVTVDKSGCPPSPDRDGDGILNEADRCPDTPRGMRVDGSGCVVKQTVSFSNITFAFNSSELTASGRAVIDGIAAGLLDQKELLVDIGGHTDPIGSQAKNLELSQRRANAVRNYLISKGVESSRLRAQGYGELSPLVSNETEAGRAQNRRVEFNIRR